MTRALTVLPVPLGLRYLLGSLLVVFLTVALVGHTSVETAKQVSRASIGVSLLALFKKRRMYVW